MNVHPDIPTRDWEDEVAMLNEKLAEVWWRMRLLSQVPI